MAVAAYVTNGDVKLLEGADQNHLLTFLNTLYRVGLDFTVEDDAIRFNGGTWPPKSIALETDVHPWFHDRLATAFHRVTDAGTGDVGRPRDAL